MGYDGGMGTNGSAVIEVMQRASCDSWRKWRKHVEAGTAHTPEAMAAFDIARDAAAAWIGEVADRDQLASREKARAA